MAIPPFANAPGPKTPPSGYGFSPLTVIDPPDLVVAGFTGNGLTGLGTNLVEFDMEGYQSAVIHTELGSAGTGTSVQVLAGDYLPTLLPIPIHPISPSFGDGSTTQAVVNGQDIGFNRSGRYVQVLLGNSGGTFGPISAVVQCFKGPLPQRDMAPADSTWIYASASAGITSAATATLAPAINPRTQFIQYLDLKNIGATATVVTLSSGSVTLWQGYLPATMFNTDVIRFDPPLSAGVLSTGLINLNAAIILTVATLGATVYANAKVFTLI